MIDYLKNEGLFQRIFQSSVEGVLVTNQDGIILMTNPACEQLFGYGHGTLIGKDIEILIPKKYRQQHKKHIKSYTKTPKVRAVSADVDLYGIKKDGIQFSLDISLSPTIIDNKTVTVAFLRDASERKNELEEIKKVNSKLIESNRKYNTLLNNLHGIVYRCKNDRDWTMEFISEACLDITGYSPEEFLNGKVHFSQITFKEDQEQVWIETQKGIEDCCPYTLNFRIKDKKGTIKYVQEFGRGIYDKNGKLEALEGFITDVTAQKETEAQLRLSEAKTKTLLETIPDLIFEYDKNFKYLQVHASPNAPLVLPINQLIGKHIDEVLSPDVSKPIKKAILKAHQSKKIVIEEIKIPVNRDKIIYECRFMPFNRDKILVIARDVTKERISEQIAKQNEAKIKAILKAIPDLMFIQDHKGKFLDWYAKSPEQLFIPPERFVGEHMKKVLPSNIYQIIKATQDKVMASGKIQIAEYSFKRQKDFEYYEARVVPMNDHKLLTLVRDITEKKYNERELLIKDRALASARNSIIISDAQQPDTPIVYFNKAFEEMTGYTSEETIGRNCNFLQNDDRNQKEVDIMKNAVVKGEFCQVVLRNYKKDGTLFWNDVTITPVYNSDHKLTHFIGVQIDVTNKIKEEQLKDQIRKTLELIAEDRPLKSICNHIIETAEAQFKDCIASILMLNKEHKMLHELASPNVPKGFSKLIEGLAIGPKAGSCGTAAFLKKEIIVSDIATNVLWEDYKVIRETALNGGIKACWSFPVLSSNNKVLGTFTIYSKHSRKPLPSEKEIILDLTYLARVAIEKHKNTSALRDNKRELENYTQLLEETVQERTQEVMATVQNLVATNLNLEDQITITKRAEAEAIKSKALTTEIAKNFPKGFIVVMSKDLKLVLAEGEALEQLGLKPFVFAGMKLDDVSVFAEERKARIKEDIAKTLSGKCLSFEIEYKNRYFSVNTAPLFDRNGEMIYALMVYNDISEQKEIEFSIQNALKKEQELNELKSRFVSMASHEFRTPLSAILTSAILIRKQNEPKKKHKREKYVAQIEKNVNHLIAILNDFLSLSKLEEGKTRAVKEQFEIIHFSKMLINESKVSLKKAQNITLKTTLDHLYVNLDAKLLRHIVTNLLSNASKYARENTVINFKIEEIHNKVLIQITDQGIGIPEDEQKQIFDRFFRAKNAVNIEGTGLGLNIAKHYTELMGGTIGFESKLNVGTNFWIELPIDNNE